jgi:hypothetical protein
LFTEPQPNGSDKFSIRLLDSLPRLPVAAKSRVADKIEKTSNL